MVFSLKQGYELRANFEIGTPYRIGFLLFEPFPILPAASAIDALRMANRLAGKELYQWQLISLDGNPIQTSSHMTVIPDRSIGEMDDLDMLILVAGTGIESFQDKIVFNKLREWARSGRPLGAVTLAPYLLARAGLLDGYRFTLHWENLDTFREEFPLLNPTPDVFEIDRNRLTSSGGTACLDMMLCLTGLQHGPQLAAEIADSLIHQNIRDESDTQRMPLRTRVGVSNAKLLHAVELLENDPEAGFSRDQLARAVGLTGRQIERLFRKYLGTTPRQYHLDFRMERARRMLRQTTMPIIDVAIACGFATPSHFSKVYRTHYGRTPSDERRFDANLVN